MKRSKFDISRAAAEKFLSDREGAKVEITEYRKLGSGWHGTGYKIVYKIKRRAKEAVLRTISPLGFSHDHPSDRAQVFLLQNRLFNSIPSHVRSVGVGGLSKDGGLISLGDAQEFFQIVEVARGVPYADDLEEILKRGKMLKGDADRAIALSDYLARLHKDKFSGSPDEERSLRLRHLRDAVGHGEMLLGVIDTYPEKITFADGDELSEIVCSAVKFAQRIKNLDIPLARMHGDYHPGNIWFNEEGDFTLLDASREVWGFAADDITALTINYIRFALLHSGKFNGPFAELFGIFWENYLKRTKDELLIPSVAPFYAFRGMVVAHPVFYSKDPDEIKKRILSFVRNILMAESFDPRDMNSYLEVK